MARQGRAPGNKKAERQERQDTGEVNWLARTKTSSAVGLLLGVLRLMMKLEREGGRPLLTTYTRQQLSRSSFAGEVQEGTFNLRAAPRTRAARLPPLTYQPRPPPAACE